LLCLVAVFVAAVLVTPKIWRSNERATGEEAEAKPRSDSS
jgi:hypothetical protein